MTKRIISIFLAIALFFSTLPQMVVVVNATEPQKGDGWGNWSDYVLEDTVVIYPVEGGNVYLGQADWSGEGTASGPFSEIDLLSADSTVNKVVIPSSVNGLPVTTISESAFHDCSQLTYVEIPTTIEYVWGTCFMGCSNLKEVRVADGNPNCYSVDGVLYTKGFNQWTNSSTLTLEVYPAAKEDEQFAVPDGVTSISQWALGDAVNLRSISIPDSVTNIQSAAFGDRYSNVNFTDIYYEGSEARWKEILVGSEYGYDTIESTLIHFNRYEPFAKSIGEDSAWNWNTLYYDYIVQDRANADSSDDWEWVTYELVYLDNDNIPELWITYQYWAAGCRLVTIDKNSISQSLLSTGSLFYSEYNNAFFHSGGKMDVYFDTVYKLENGDLSTIAEGCSEVTWSKDGSSHSTTYFWNESKVSEQEYTSNLNEFVNESERKQTLSSQSSIYDYDGILDYLSTVDVTSDEMLPDTIEIKAYAAVPDDTIGTGQEVKILFSMYVNGEQKPIESYLMGISNPDVLECTEATKSDDDRIITVKGLKPGTAELTFTEIDTGTTVTISVTVEDQCHYYRCFVFPQPDKYCSSIFVADYTCTVDQNGNHDITFNAYNTSYAYGVVEVYNENGTLIKLVPLDPRSDGSGMEKVVNGFKWVWDDIRDLFNGDTPFYIKEAYAKHTPVSLEDIPENAEIIISSDGKASDFATLYTGVDVFVRTVFAATSIDLKVEGQTKTVKELMNALADSLIKTISHEESEKMIKQGLIKETTKSISTAIAFGSSVDSISAIYEAVNNMFSSLDIDAAGIMQNVLKGMGYSVADTAFTTAVPLYKIVNFVDQILETAWPIVDYQLNLDTGRIEIHVAKHRLQNIVSNSSVTITQQANFGDNVVLDAYEVLDNDEIAAISGMIPAELTNYAVYSITLRENGMEVQPSGDIEVRLPVPDSLDGTKCAVYRIEDNGDCTLLSSSFDDGDITFVTSHLSYYIIGETADSTVSPDVNPPARIIIPVLIGGCAVAVMALIWGKRKRATNA